MLSIAQRIAILVGLPILSIGAIVTTQTLATRSVSASATVANDAQRLQATSGQMGRTAAALQAAAADYLRTSSPEQATRFDKLNDEAASQTETLRNLETTFPSITEDRERIATMRGTVVDAFRAMVKARTDMGVDAKTGFTGALGTAAGRIEAVVDEAAQTGTPDAVQLQIWFLNTRRAEKDFMLYGTQAEQEKWAKALRGFEAFVMMASMIPPEQLAAMNVTIKDYRDGVQRWSEASTASAGAMQRLVASIGALEGGINQLTRKAAEFGSQAAASRQSTERTAATAFWAIAGVSLVAMLGLGLMFGAGLNRIIRQLAGTMRKLADGDTSVTVPYLGVGNVVGEMATAIDTFRGNALERIALGERAEAENQARIKRQERIAGAISAFENNAQRVMEGLGRSVSHLETSATDLSDAAGSTSHQATSVAAASEQATASVETVAAAAEELGGAIGEIGHNIEESSQIAAEARTLAQTTNGDVQELSRAASTIGDVVKLISDIAAQTNLLALNATIEAARAGDAGRGFAVVASEVKSLADQTARATQDIAMQIGGIQTATGKAVTSIGSITGIIARIDEITARISDAVGKQSNATQEIGRNVRQAADGTRDVSRNITAVNASAEITGRTADGLRNAAGDLQTQSAELNRQVAEFLSEVRTA